MTNAEFLREIRTHTGIKVGDNEEIDLPDDRPATESFADFVSFLFNKEYLSKNDLPIKSGSTRFLLNTEPTHQNGDEMVRPIDISSGIYLERNFNKDGIRRKIRYLCRTV